jgi:hypothetical protein
MKTDAAGFWIVIASASEAIHAWYRKQERWIASSQVLLAMTSAHTSHGLSISQRLHTHLHSLAA